MSTISYYYQEQLSRAYELTGTRSISDLTEWIEKRGAEADEQVGRAVRQLLDADRTDISISNVNNEFDVELRKPNGFYSSLTSTSKNLLDALSSLLKAGWPMTEAQAKALHVWGSDTPVAPADSSSRMAKIRCPYCGHNTLAIAENKDPVYYQVTCRGCGIAGPRHKNELGAYRLWLSIYGAPQK